MSKTIQIQIEKSKMLLNGLRENIAEVSKHGINENQLTEMENVLEKLSVANDECDAMRLELSKIVKNMNQILTLAKEQFTSKKKVIKMNYPQEEWNRYGVQDKR